MTHQQDIEKLRELMKDVKFCMLTSVHSDGTLRSRPMTLQDSEFDGDLWFFTGRSTTKSDEVREHHQVNVAFADPGHQKYVSVSGQAELVDDRAKARELWSEAYKLWFPKGVDDPDLTLLKVHVERAEYWDSPGGVVTYLVGFVKSLAGGERPKVGEHEKIELAP